MTRTPGLSALITFTALIFLTAFWQTGFAAEPTIIDKSAAIRQTAETQLSDLRTRVATERAVLMRDLQAAQQAAQQTRQAYTQARTQRDQLRTQVEQAQQTQAALTLNLERLAERAVVAANADAPRDLPSAQRITMAINQAFKRLDQLPTECSIHETKADIIARDGLVVTESVLHLGDARSFANGASDNTRGLLLASATGPARVVGPTLAPSDSATRLPPQLYIDSTGTAAGKKPVAKRNFKEWLAAGRFFIWPIVVVFGLGIAIACERAIAFIRLRVSPQRLLQIARMLHDGQHDQALALVQSGRTPLDRVIATGLRTRDRSREAREATIDQALLSEAPALQRGLGALLVLAGIAPLLGLLGTVTGMIDMFGIIADQGSGSAPTLSGGISEALICTQAGMLAAIPLLLIHAIWTRIADRRLMILEEAACALLGMDGQPSAPASTASAESAATL